MTVAVNSLSFSYGRIAALHGVTASAHAGRITAVIGPNAAGKSTLLRCIIGALKPTDGHAAINGHPSHRMSPREVAKAVAYVSQRPVVSAAFTVRQVVELGRFSLPADAERVDHVMGQVDILDIADRPFPQLSVGQQQRVMFARALSQLEPKGNLILDEPVSSMDLHHVHQCMRILRELANGGATVVLAIHDLTLAAAIADDAWILQSGRLISHGSACDTLSPAQLQAVFGVPFRWLDGGGARPVLVAEQPSGKVSTTMGSS